MRLLCTNDDGILAHGLDCLVRAAEPLGEVTVVAPDREQSATSHSLTLHHPLRPVRRGERRWQVDGTPTDCAMLAIEALMPERPDFVLSGINHGHNMGEDVLYSGTVAAAMEGLSLGVPAIALSFAGGDLRSDMTQARRTGGAADRSARPPDVARHAAGHAAQHQPAAASWHEVAGVRLDATRPARVLQRDGQDAGSVGAADLLDRRRLHFVGGRRRTRTSERFRTVTLA